MHALALTFVLLGVLAVHASPHRPHAGTPSARDKQIRDLDVIKPCNWPWANLVPADVLEKAAFVVSGSGDGKGTDVLVHTHDSRTYLYTEWFGWGEKEELRGIKMKDGKISMRSVSSWNFFVLLSDSGDVYTVGDNGRRQLGYETTYGRTSEFRQVPGLSNIIQIAVGGAHTTALTQGRQVFFFGDIHVSFASERSPRRVNFTEHAGFVPAQISAGESHSLVLSEDGRSILGWGYNYENELGLGRYEGTVSLQKPQATRIPDGVQLKAVYGGDHSGFALDVDGKLWQWGSDGYGALGQGGKNQPVPTNDRPTMKTKTVAALRVSGVSSVAITTDDEVYIWGGYQDGNVLSATRVYGASSTPLDVFAGAVKATTGGAAHLAPST